MELNRDQIIKALECCINDIDCCYDCPFSAADLSLCGGLRGLSAEALALIKELTEENEDLNKTISSLLETIKDIKAETVRKIKTQVHNKAIYPSTKGDVAYISLKAFDALADGLISDKN